MRQIEISLRATPYTLLHEQLCDPGSNEKEFDAVESDSLYILSSTCVGGSCYMRQNVLDIIPVPNMAGYSKTFQTTTCNLQRPEIKNALLPGQSVIDRPDTAVQVFCVKLSSLVAFLVHEKIFGVVKAHFRVVVSKKRVTTRKMNTFHGSSIKSQSSKFDFFRYDYVSQNSLLAKLSSTASRFQALLP